MAMKIQLDKEIVKLIDTTEEMWRLVMSQIEKTYDVLMKDDKDLAREIIANEKRVNSLELKIDRDCVDIFALHNPVAVDLRKIISILKINVNLERIGDVAHSIAEVLRDKEKAFNKELLEEISIFPVFQHAIEMTMDNLYAFMKDDSNLARVVFKKDELIDTIYWSSFDILANYAVSDIDSAQESLILSSILRKLERVGDHNKNIAEEIIYYTDAKVIKHEHKNAD